ncbi:MAG TPA: MarC family protein [Candidatus Aerophobetes bacterium]|nr:MarC family protein [Candidatus Aerophobetes bacterium]
MFFNSFILSFIPVFVAVDAFGVLPIFISLTEGMKKREKVRVVRQSVLTALIIAIAFIFVGKAIFLILGVTVQDFMIAGGTVLFILSVVDLLFPTKQRRTSTIGVVPLGMPLIAGPAVLTTSLVSVDAFGVVPTLLSVILNILLAGFVFFSSDFLMKILGTAGSRGISKVSSLLLAAIGVMMVRRGIMQILSGI